MEVINHRNDVPLVGSLTEHISGGPRVCIGQRFAMVELKITVAHLLYKFRIVDSPGTSINMLDGSWFLKAFTGPMVIFEKRQD